MRCRASCRRASDSMIERMDRNNNGALERQELSRGGGAMSAVAGRYVDRLKIDVDAELAKLKKSEGEAFNRFEQQPMPLDEIRDPSRPGSSLPSSMKTPTGNWKPKEVPDPLQEPIERLMRIADRDNDGKLTQDEFVAATERIVEVSQARRPDGMPARERKSDAQSEAGRVDFGEEVARAASRVERRLNRGGNVPYTHPARRILAPVGSSPAPALPAAPRANRELCQHVLRNRFKPSGCRNPKVPAGSSFALRFGPQRGDRDAPAPPAANPLVAGVDCPWLPPISFGVEPYLKLCQSFDQALKELEARFPSHRPLLTLEAAQEAA